MAQKINSRKKGSKNERNLTKLFQEWTGVEFSRVPASGGLRWQGMEEIIVGDIIPSGDIHFAIDFPFSIETKSYADLDFIDPILDNKSKIYDFWSQSKRDAKRAKKHPIVFMRKNRMPKNLYLVEISIGLHRALHLDKYYFIQFDEDFVVMRSDDFFNTDYKQIANTIKQWDYDRKRN